MPSRQTPPHTRRPAQDPQPFSPNGRAPEHKRPPLPLDRGIAPTPAQGTFANPVIAAEGMDHGDPFVMEHLGTYYLYHTGREGVYLYTSTDLANWKPEGVVLGPGPDGHWAQTDFWAPEILLHEGVFYLYVAATRKKFNGKGDDKKRRLGLARALDPRGPFVWDEAPLVGWEWSIDGHPFRDQDGGLWLFYNVRTEATRYQDGTVGCGNVVGRMSAPDRLEAAQTPVAFPSHRWEGSHKGDWYWNEGPFVLKRRGVYYQMYSGGCYAEETYGLGFATAPAPTGPWDKQTPEPILRSSRKIFGPGHHCVVRGPDGVTPYVVYHGYLPHALPAVGRPRLRKGRKVHLDRIHWAGDRMAVSGPTHTAQPLPPQPVYDPAVPHWHLSAWVSGSELRLGAVRLPLPAGQRHLRVAQQGGRLWATLDGVRLFEGECRVGRVEVEGVIERAAHTSWLEDEAIHALAAGEARSWPWGGRGEVEVSLAVKGAAAVTAGRQRVEVNAPDRFELVHLRAGGGLDELRVEALGGGASVADVTLTARSL